MIVGGRRPVSSDRTEAAASAAPLVAIMWPVMDLLAVTGIRAARAPNTFLMANVSATSFFGVPMPWDIVLFAAVRQLVIWALNVVVWLTIIYVVISWVNPHAPFAPAFDLLLRPLLTPIRRILPTIGGFDLSPMVLLIGVYVIQMVVARL